MTDQTTEAFEINPADPASLARCLQQIVRRLQSLHKDIGLLSLTIGTLVNAGDAGLLAQPNATREIVRRILENFGKEAPLAALQIGWGLEIPFDPPPPKGRKRLRIVQDEKTAA